MYELKTKGGLVDNKIVKIDNVRIIINQPITDTDLRKKIIEEYGFELIEGGLK